MKSPYGEQFTYGGRMLSTKVRTVQPDLGQTIHFDKAISIFQE